MEDRRTWRGWEFPGVWLYPKLPNRLRYNWTARIKLLYREQSIQSDHILHKMAQAYIIRQLAILCWGSLLMILFSGSIFLAGRFLEKNNIEIERNAYGAGSKTLVLQVGQDEEKEEFLLEIGEQTLSEKARDQYYQEFFDRLEEVMLKENSSLQEVTGDLNLPDRISGYPFQIQYELKDPSYIDYAGRLTKKTLDLQGQIIETKLTVTASYGEAQEKKSYTLTIKPKKAVESKLSKLEKKIQKTEQGSRKEKIFQLPAVIDGISIQQAGLDSPVLFCLFLMGFAMLALLLRRYYALKEKGQRAKESAVEDFTLIVHLLSLYMGAGLSFSRAIHRIHTDYKKGKLNGDKGKRYAFEQISVVDQQIQMGVSQKVACEQWGQRMNQEYYRKLSVILIQCLSKGSQEVRIYMNQMEGEAFRNYVDQIRKRGEEASSKLLMPMVLLMIGVMIIVIFPAMMQFQNF